MNQIRGQHQAGVGVHTESSQHGRMKHVDSVKQGLTTHLESCDFCEQRCAWTRNRPPGIGEPHSHAT